MPSNAAHRRDWIAAAVVGAIAWTPILLSIVGWASHWNAYTNIMLWLAGCGLCAVVWKAWSA